MNYYIFLLGSLALGSECYDYLFTDCEHNGTRTAVFFPTQKCENFTLPEPIFNLSCNLECPAGKYLDLDIDTLQSKCSECPANTFSIGGGEKFLQNDWGNFVYSFSTYCWTMGFYNWELNSNCEAWHSKNGQTVSSGSAFEDTWFESSLVYHAHMVKNGTVKFTYRKEMNIHNNATNGLFAVYIDDDQVLRDKDATQIGWKTVVLEIPIGLHNIAFIYDKYSTNQDNNAEISYFEIRGTQSASHFCSPCETGFSNPGSDSCDICPANSFYFPTATQNCLECPDDNYSLPGSTSIVDCKPRQDCTESDYSWKYTSCMNNTRSKTYFWNTPMICNNSTLSLPENIENLTCELCNAGYYHHEKTDGSECEPCEDGTSMTETKVENECLECQPGLYAPKVLNYTHWNVIDGFENHCVPSSGEKCGLSVGWEARGTCISSGVHADFNSDIVLIKKVRINEMSSYVSFEFSLYNIQSINTKLLFFVDGVLKASYNENLENQVSEKFELSKGLRVLKWVYKHYPDTNDSQDKCNINAILITGSDEGGAPECIKCPIGFTSTIKSLECNPCPPGSSSDDGNLACIPCPNGFYSEKAGQACVECPKNTMVNQNKTACIVSDYLSLKNGTYYITSLTGIVGMNEGNPSLYCKDESMRLYCHETFYGPVLGSDNYFYLSVFNPSNFSLATYSNYDDMRKGYAFGVVSKTKIPYIESDPTQPKEECVKDYSMAVVNLGTRVDSIQETPKGFVVKYGTGSYCNVQKNKRFMTQVNFICDKVESDGWPVFQGQIDCIFAFRWKTMHACKICTSAMMIEKRSYCDNGKRTVQLFESPDCIVANGTSYKSWQEDCNINEDLIQTWPVIIGLCTLGGLLIISGIMIICFCKYKRKYNRLVEYREDGRVSEDARQIEMSDQA